jgi:leucyl aminopeptidase
MKIKTIYGVVEKSRSDVDVFLFFKDDTKTINGAVRKFGITAAVLADRGFSGDKDEIFELYSKEIKTGITKIFLGLGPKEKYAPDKARRAGGVLAGLLTRRSFDSATLIHIPSPDISLGSFIEGIILGGYHFDKYKTDKKKPLSLRLAVAEKYRKHKKAIGKSIVLAEAACYTRDLVNTPANFLTPSSYAMEARSLGRKFGIKTRIYSQREIEVMKMGALLGVAKGSDQPPRLITFVYNGGKRGEAPLVLVGKGVTFDSGGISLKPNESMVDMKDDMAGSAAVISQMIVLGKLKPRINVVGIVPAVENMPSGKALKPSDIITASDGQTIEVLNTDAEGRLILADALCFAHRFKPRAIIDIATLTGACKIALGTGAAGILGNDDNLLKQLYEIGQKTSEKTWQLPLWDEYYEQIKSEMADMKNTGGRPG